jgi:hypothetical protein
MLKYELPMGDETAFHVRLDQEVTSKHSNGTGSWERMIGPLGRRLMPHIKIIRDLISNVFDAQPSETRLYAKAIIGDDTYGSMLLANDRTSFAEYQFSPGANRPAQILCYLAFNRLYHAVVQPIDDVQCADEVLHSYRTRDQSHQDRQAPAHAARSAIILPLNMLRGRLLLINSKVNNIDIRISASMPAADYTRVHDHDQQFDLI